MSDKEVIITKINDLGEACPKCHQDHAMMRVDYDLHLEDHESGGGSTYWCSFKKCVMCNYVERRNP